MNALQFRGRLAAIAVLVSILTGCGSQDVDPGETIHSSGNGNGDNKVNAEYQLGVQREPFGQTASGIDIDQYLLTNKNGLRVGIINFGAAVTSIAVPDAKGNIANVTLGFDDLAGYEENSPYFGVVCGRYANRIANGKFTLEGTDYQLAINDDPNHLHGGIKGFNKVVWKAESIDNSAQGSVGVRLNYVSPDEEENYPGTLKIEIVYTLNDNNEFRIDYSAESDKATPVNLTNHTYWNLAGDGDVLEHRLTLNCDRFLPVSETLIPTGELKNVQNTPMDFKSPTAIGSRIDDVPGGYDHCYVINSNDDSLKLLARVEEPTTGRVLEIRTTEPGAQLYTGNFLDGSPKSGGFQKHQGFCLECQHFPDSPNQPDFPTTILQPGEVYKQTTVHKFSVAP